MIHPQTEVVLNQLTRNVFWSSPHAATDRPVLGAVVGDHSTIIVDAGNSAAHASSFLRALSQHDVPPVRYLFFTHAHWDHIFGASQFQDVLTLAHVATAKKIEGLSRLKWDDDALEERVRTGEEVAFCRDMMKAELSDRSEVEIIPPRVAFDGRVEINLGGMRCVLEHVGGDHAEDSSIAYIPSERIVFIGDCLAGRLYGKGPLYRFEDTVSLLDQLLGYEAESYVFGHASQVVPRSRIETWRELLGMLARNYGASPDDLQRRLDELTVPGKIDLSTIDANFEGSNL